MPTGSQQPPRHPHTDSDDGRRELQPAHRRSAPLPSRSPRQLGSSVRRWRTGRSSAERRPCFLVVIKIIIFIMVVLQDRAELGSKLVEVEERPLVACMRWIIWRRVHLQIAGGDIIAFLLSNILLTADLGQSCTHQPLGESGTERHPE